MTIQLNVLEKSNVIHVKSPMVMYIHYFQLPNHTSFEGLFFKRSFKILKSMEETTINETQSTLQSTLFLTGIEITYFEKYSSV